MNNAEYLSNLTENFPYALRILYEFGAYPLIQLFIFTIANICVARNIKNRKYY